MDYPNREFSVPVPTTWAELPESIRGSLQGKLAGLYGHGEDETAFAAATQDKREALVLLMRRLVGLDLWKHVGKIVDVYGEGGVGICTFSTSIVAAVPRIGMCTLISMGRSVHFLAPHSISITNVGESSRPTGRS